MQCSECGKAVRVGDDVVSVWCDHCTNNGIDMASYPGNTPVGTMSLRVTDTLRAAVTVALETVLRERAALYSPNELGHLEVVADICDPTGSVASAEVKVEFTLRLTGNGNGSSNGHGNGVNGRGKAPALQLTPHRHLTMVRPPCENGTGTPPHDEGG